jgi:hypothetical protein
MSHLLRAFLLCLLLAGGATAASCLIPQLTVAGIWGIPVLGFALFVGVVFRVAVYYDPREPQTQAAKRYATCVAVILIAYVAVFSNIEKMFQKGQHVAAILGTIFGIVSLLSAHALTEYMWVTSQTREGSFPIICTIRRFLVFIPSIVFVIASFAGDEGLAKVMKPIVIFIGYTHAVFFSAVYCGIFRLRIPYAPNETIAERLETWLRSIAERIRGWLHSTTRPGNLLVTIEAVFSLVFIGWIFIEAGCEIPVKFRLIPKAIFTVIVAITFYKAGDYDPRKPPEEVSLVTRVLTLFAHFAISVYLEVYVEFFRKGDDSATFTVHLVSLALLIFLRTLVIYWCLMNEYENAHLCNSRLFVIVIHNSVYTIASLCYVYATMYNRTSEGFFAARAFTHSWFYVTTLMIVSIIAGKHRPVVRQEPPEDHVIIVV